MVDTSTYAKIRDIVATVRRMRRCTMDDLTAELTSRANAGENGFVYFRRNGRGTIESQPCSEATMRKHVRFCQELGFLSEDAEIGLADAIKGIRSREDFNAALEAQLIEYLDKRKATIASIERAIRSANTPDPETIYNSLPNKSISEDRFRSCLHLLSLAGNAIVPYQKKIYLLRG